MDFKEPYTKKLAKDNDMVGKYVSIKKETKK